MRPADSDGTPPQVDGRRLGEAFAVLGNAASNPAEARRRVGQIALAAETGPEQAHIARMRATAGADQWPDRKLLITVLDAETGEKEVFDRASGAPLPSAVAAGTAFPGIYHRSASTAADTWTAPCGRRPIPDLQPEPARSS
ncbi:hypothetical protein [Streptomyces sp. SLBN-118]|uniref:hypothetical protein n=1 Tax=Streptomyces sp. SLBN-118 TaxID=2768454 RepID=UPI00114DB926|nr:hypothetical protein [Streptomyces sp. SLBN-118]